MLLEAEPEAGKKQPLPRNLQALSTSFRFLHSRKSTRIDELFAIDAEARHQTLSLEACHALRQEQSRPLLGVIEKQIEAARFGALPGGALAKACL
jgi:hypothetical protein